ncbi:MAG: phosphodiester glycosidase family protein [Clostridia bacterium]|nr:phosphodiester glycosidase family protein [Clostridia bacterium]
MKKLLKRSLVLVMLAVLLIPALPAVGEELEDTYPLPTMTPVEFPDYVQPLPIKEDMKYVGNPACFSEDGFSYHDDSLDVKVHKIRVYDTPVAVAFVQIAHPSQLRTEQARKYPSQTTIGVSEIARRVNAVFCTNADWFVYHNAGVIYRKGELLRDRPNEEYDGLFIDVNGDFHIVAPLTREGVDALDEEIVTSFCFGPALVIDGEMCEIDRRPKYKQRTAFGQLGPLQYVLVATDGPMEKNSVGFTHQQIAQLMYDLGCINAYNLDGGTSTTMLLNYTKMNGQKALKMRSVGDILYFATAIPSEGEEK